MIEKKRFHHIDLLESIAILFVVMYHSTIYVFDFLENNAVVNFLSYYGRTILSTCVPLFFFSNGYLLFNKDFNLKKHIYKIIRLILLVIFWGFFLVSINMLISGVPLNFKSILFNVLELSTTYKVNIFWFMGSLVCIYIVFPALKAIFGKKSFLFFTFVCFIVSFGFVFANLLLSILCTVSHHEQIDLNFKFITMYNPFYLRGAYTFVYFCVGGLAYLYENKILSIKKAKRNIISIVGLPVSCALLFLVGVYYSKINGKIYDIVWNGYDSIFTFFNVIFIYLLCLNYSSNNSIIKGISCNTLGIYFIHEIIIGLTSPLIKKVSFLCNYPINIVYAILIVLICWLICLLFKKIPLLRKLV